MSETRHFTLGAVLSMTTGVLLCDLGDLYALASFMLGRDVYTHELPAAFREGAPALLAQHPQLDDVDTTGLSGETWRPWLSEQVARFGPSLPVEPLTWSPTAEKSPLETAAELFGEDRVIAIDATQGDS